MGDCFNDDCGGMGDLSVNTVLIECNRVPSFGGYPHCQGGPSAHGRSRGLWFGNNFTHIIALLYHQVATFLAVPIHRYGSLKLEKGYREIAR